jgi:hypothetical protein
VKLPRISGRGPDWAAIEAEDAARAVEISADLEADHAEVYFDSLEDAREAVAAGGGPLYFGSLTAAHAWVSTQIEVDALATVETPADLLPEPEAEL